MKKIAAIFTAAALLASPFVASASPQSDLKSFKNFFLKTNDLTKGTPYDDFINGVYAVDKASRAQWEEFEEFPSYEIYVDKGEDLFKNTKFKNGKGFSSCFGKTGKGVKAKYPYFDGKSGKVVTMESAINACITKNGSEKWGWKKGKMAYLSAYMASQSRGLTINVKTPSSKEELAAYNRGKQHFYAKRGQLNMSCADCHYYNAGKRIRADVLSPALGHVSHFPVYRNKWASKSGDGMGTLHRRYGGCNKQVRARPFKAQSAEYSALEYFHTYMSNGLKWNGPGQRK